MFVYLYQNKYMEPTDFLMERRKSMEKAKFRYLDIILHTFII